MRMIVWVVTTLTHPWSLSCPSLFIQTTVVFATFLTTFTLLQLYCTNLPSFPHLSSFHFNTFQVRVKKTWILILMFIFMSCDISRSIFYFYTKKYLCQNCCHSLANLHKSKPAHSNAWIFLSLLPLFADKRFEVFLQQALYFFLLLLLSRRLIILSFQKLYPETSSGNLCTFW